MNGPSTTIEIINIAALIVGPIAAVIITLWYQRRVEKRSAKERLFSVLMAHRQSNPPPMERVNALNLIDVVFASNRAVVQKWHEMYNELNKPADQINWRQAGHLHIELLSEIALVLGYHRLPQTSIDRFYLPQNVADQASLTAEIQRELLRVLKGTQSLSAEPKERPEQTSGPAGS